MLDEGEESDGPTMDQLIEELTHAPAAPPRVPSAPTGRAFRKAAQDIDRLELSTLGSKLPLQKSKAELNVEGLEPQPHSKRHRSQESAEPSPAPSEFATPRSTPRMPEEQGPERFDVFDEDTPETTPRRDDGDDQQDELERAIEQVNVLPQDNFEGLFVDHALFANVSMEDAFMAFLASRQAGADPEMADWIERVDNSTDVAVHLALLSKIDGSNTSGVPSVPPWMHKKVARGREIPWSHIRNTAWEEPFIEALAKEWKQWLVYDAVEPLGIDYEPAEDENVLDLRVMCSDRKETERGARTYVEIPLDAKC